MKLEVNVEQLVKETSIWNISAPIVLDGLCLDVTVDYYPDGEFDHLNVWDEDGNCVKLTQEQEDLIVNEISKNY